MPVFCKEQGGKTHIYTCFEKDFANLLNLGTMTK